MKDLSWKERILLALYGLLALVVIIAASAAGLWLKGYMIHLGWSAGQ